MTELLGKTLGRYRLDHLLGRGGMAQVYKAWDPNTQRYVAVKVLYAHLASEPGFKERFAREGALIASLNHPNIVGIYDFDRVTTEAGTFHYMVMPFITGPTLRDRIAGMVGDEICMPLEEVVYIVHDLAKALDYAHARDMAHRDIKPANIIFDEHNKPMLTDFGLARLNSGERFTETSLTLGTPAYMSPEQGLGEAGDNLSDIYALGIILYELLTGQLPFSSDTSFAYIMKHISEPLPSLRQVNPEIPPAVEAVVYRAAAKQSAERYQTAGELAQELEAAVLGAPISRETMSISGKAQAASGVPAGAAGRPQRGLLLLGALSVIALLVLAAAVLQSGMGAVATDGPSPTAEPVINAMTGGPVPFSANFEAGDDYNFGWPVTTEGLFTRQIQDGQYRMRSQLGNQAHTAIFDESFSYTSLIVEVDGVLLDPSQPDSGFGLVFRYHDEESYYVFAINGRRQVSIWKRHDGIWTELRGGENTWTVNEAVNPIGEENHLSVLAVGSEIAGFVNGQRVVTVEDDSLVEGAVGFYIATTQRSVEEVMTDVAFDNFMATNAVPAMTGP